MWLQNWLLFLPLPFFQLSSEVQEAVAMKTFHHGDFSSEDKVSLPYMKTHFLCFYLNNPNA